MSRGLHSDIVEQGDCMSETALLDYAHNQLSGAEKNKVEKHLLDCELCSDALEGLSLIKKSDTVKELKKEVIQRFGKKENSQTNKGGKIIHLDFKTTMAIAASLAILIISVLIYKSSINEETIVAESITKVNDEEKTKSDGLLEESENSKQEPSATTPLSISSKNIVTDNKEPNTPSKELKNTEDEVSTREEEGVTTASPQAGHSTTMPIEEEKPLQEQQAAAKTETVEDKVEKIDTPYRMAKDEDKKEQKKVSIETAKKSKQKSVDVPAGKAQEYAAPASTQTSIAEGEMDDDVSENMGSAAFTDKGKTDNEVFTLVEEMPQFPGGDEKMRTFLKDNIQYPKKATENGIQGTVYINFIIEKDGTLTNFKLLKGIPNGEECNNEAMRVVKLMPKWSSGKQNNNPVRVQYTLPIKFTLP